MATTTGLAFEDQVQPLSQMALRFAFTLTGNRHDAEDLLQSSMLLVFKHWRKVSAAESIPAYTRKVVLNEYLSRRRRKLRHILVGDAFFATLTADYPDRAQDEPPAMWQALQALTRPQRAVLVLRYYEDLPDREIAAVLNVPEATVRSHARRGLERLRRSLI